VVPDRALTGDTPGEAGRGAGRFAMARSFALAFGPPGEAQRALLGGSDWLEDLAARGLLGGREPSDLRQGLPPDPGGWESFVLSTFEVGCPAPPVPLLETHYLAQGSRGAVLHENILFYKAFGGRREAGAAESPDHLRTQLGFVCFLCWLEEEAGAPAETVGAARRARRDFVERRLLSWLPEAARAARQGAHPLWAALLEALATWLSREFAAPGEPASL